MQKTLNPKDFGHTHEKKCLELGKVASSTLTPWKESYDQPRQHIKKQRHYFANKVHLVKAMVFQWSCMDVRVGKKTEH